MTARLLPCTATSAVRFPAADSASKMVGVFTTGFSYFWIPCTWGLAPVYMLAKQTGVTAGMTVASSSSMGAQARTGAKSPAYFWQSHIPSASGL